MSAWAIVYVATWPLVAAAVLRLARRSWLAAWWLFWLAVAFCAPLLALKLFRAFRFPAEDAELGELRRERDELVRVAPGM